MGAAGATMGVVVADVVDGDGCAGTEPDELGPPDTVLAPVGDGEGLLAGSRPQPTSGQVNTATTNGTAIARDHVRNGIVAPNPETFRDHPGGHPPTLSIASNAE